MDRAQDAGDVDNQGRLVSRLNVSLQERNEGLGQHERSDRVDGEGFDHLVGGHHVVPSRLGSITSVVDQAAESGVLDL